MGTPFYSLKGSKTVAVGKRSAAHGSCNPESASTLKGSYDRSTLPGMAR